MAHHLSAKKSIRKNAARNSINRARKSRIRTFVKKAQEAAISGNIENAQEAFRIAQSELSRAVTKGSLHKKTASRKISRICKKMRSAIAS